MSARVIPEGRERCRHQIEREWPGHRVVLSRRRCKRLAIRGQHYCWQHA